MQLVQLSGTGTPVSEMCLGPDYYGSRPPTRVARQLLDEFAGDGGTFLDTANIYACFIPGFVGGESETVIGQWMVDPDHGCRDLLAWMRGYGPIRAIGVESTGSFGAALTRSLTTAGETVIGANRPNRQARRMEGKSDRLDAEQIARAVLGKIATAIPKTKSGTVEVIRSLRVARASAVKARTQAFNNLFGLMIGAPSPLRDELVVLTKRTLVNRCIGLRPETDDLIALTHEPARLLIAGIKTVLRDLLADGRHSTKKSKPSAGRSRPW